MNILILISLCLEVVTAHMTMDSMAQSPYAAICLQIYGNLYQFNGINCPKTTFRHAQCFCSDERFVLSVVGCIDQYMSNVTESQRNSMRHAAYHTVTGTCTNASVSNLTNMQKNISSLPVYSGLDSGEKPGKWPVYSAFIPTQQELWDAIQTYNLNNTHEEKNKIYGAALLGFWAGILLIKGILHWGAKLFPRAPLVLGNTTIGRLYRQYFQIRCLKYSLVTSLQALIILGFSLLLLCVTFLDLPYHYPSYYFRYSDMGTYGNYLGSRTGILAFYILPLLILFAGRNNFLQWLTGWTQEPFLVFHRWVARGEMFLVIAHTIAYSASRAALNRYKYMWVQAYWNWGIVSLAFGMLILVQAIRFIRHAAYETFLVIHIISAIFFLVGAYYHIKFLSEMVCFKFFYASFAVWGFDRFLRIVRIISAGVKRGTLVLEGENMLVLTVKKPRWWPAVHNPGSYVFVHFLTPYSFWQSHPLTLTASTTDPTMIKLYFRVYKGISKTLAEQTMAANDARKEIMVMLDGPYGTSHDLLEFDECLFVAGGSGITAPLAYIQNALKKSPYRKLQKVTLHWAVNDHTVLDWFSEELKFLQEDAEVIVNIYVSNQSGSELTSNASATNEKNETSQEKITAVSESRLTSINSHGNMNVYGRLNVAKVIEDAIINSEGSLSVMCCGPAGLHVETRNAIANSMRKTRNYVQYYEEAYTW